MVSFYSKHTEVEALDYSSDTQELLQKWFYSKYGFRGYPVHTCTTALEVAAMALDLGADDEVIMPSYTFVSTATAFALRGCKIVFVDVDDSMNMDLKAVEKAITIKTKVIVPVHYGGQSCHMDKLMEIARKNKLYVVEDAAQSLACQFNHRYLGSFGHLACMSFHHTKNIHCGEGGYIIVNDESLMEKVEAILYYGTDRKAFDRNEVDYYTWQSLGTSALLDAYRGKILLENLKRVDQVTDKRRKLLKHYRTLLKNFHIFKSNQQLENGHIFFIKTKNTKERHQLQECLKAEGIETLSHYQPLHQSKYGQRYDFIMNEGFTIDANRLLRLPIHEDMTEEDVEKVCQIIKRFYE